MDSARRAYLIVAATQAQPYPREAALAKAWLEAHIDEYDDIDWQKHVGLGVNLGADYDPGIQRMAYQATRKRVDLVGYQGETATIVELKDHVDLAAVRQAADYAGLWRASPADPPVSKVVVVGRTGDAAIADTAAALGVTVELFSSVSA
jgi:hypothetical protein